MSLGKPVKFFWMLQSSRRDQPDSPGTAHCCSLTPNGTQDTGTRLHNLYRSCPRRTKCNLLPYTHTHLLTRSACFLPCKCLLLLTSPCQVLHRDICLAEPGRYLEPGWLQENLENVVFRFLAFPVKESC